MKKSNKNLISFNRLIISVFFAIISIITLLYCESAKIKKDVIINVNGETTYFEELSVNDNTYKMSDLLEIDEEENYYSNNNISFQITNNDYIKIKTNNLVDVYIDDVKQNVLTEENLYYIETNIDKYRIAINTFNTISKIKILFIFISFILVYYLLIKIIQLFFKKLYEDNRFDIKLYLLTMISIFILYYYNLRTLINVFSYFSGLLIVGIFLYFILKYKKSKYFTYRYNYLLIAIFIGFSIMFINPPVNVLDEANHFSKVNDQFIFKGKMKFDELGRFYSYRSVELDNFIKKYDEYKVSHIDKTNIMSTYEDYVTYESDNLTKITYNTGQANQLAYIPAMIGVHAGKLLNLNVYLIFMLGRFCNLVIFILLCYLGLKIIPKFKYLMFIICTFSIFLQQGMGMNQDWFNNSSLVLLISYIFYLIFEKNKVDKKDYFIIFLLSICLAFSKTIYTVFTLLFFFVPNKKIIKNTNNKIFNKAFIIKCLVVFIAALITLFSLKFAQIFLDIPVNKTYASHLYTWSDFFANPIWGLFMIIKSVGKSCHLYFFLSYFKDFGWYKVSFPHIITLLIAMIYLCLLFIQPKEKFESRKSEWLFKFGNICIFCIIIFLVASSMFFGWTQKGSKYIDGIQGRYFLPAIFSGYLFINNNWFKKINKEKLIYISTYVIISINLFAVIYMIYGFYF